MVNDQHNPGGATPDARDDAADRGRFVAEGKTSDPAAAQTGGFTHPSTLLEPEPTFCANPLFDPAAETSKASPSMEEALQAASEIAASQGRSFDLRRALQSAVKVLTKERSFLPDEHPAARTLDSDMEPSADTEDEPIDDSRPAGLSGHTSTVAVPEVLGFLAQLRKSGTLWIWNALDQFRVQLIHGNVTFAHSDFPRKGSLLGEILVAQGAIDAQRFEHFLHYERGPGPLGDALIEAGLVTRQGLSAAIQHQAQCVFDCAYGLEDAFFRFDASDDLEAPQGIRISVTQMLFESARERDESEQRLATRPPAE
ncbi:MAG: DUF4388 domain-containing protein [Planctomycetota bacterium]